MGCEVGEERGERREGRRERRYERKEKDYISKNGVANSNWVYVFQR